MNRNRLILIQIQTLPPSMHHKWKAAIEIVMKKTDEKSIESKDNCNLNQHNDSMVKRKVANSVGRVLLGKLT